MTNTLPSAVALAGAIRDGDLPAVQALLGAGAGPNAKDPLGYPPVAHAAALGNAPMVELLLTAGADPLLPDTRMGASPLHKTAQGGVVDCARLLLDHGAFVDAQAPTHGHTPLLDAAWNKRFPMVRFLLDRGANPDVKAHGGYGVDDLAALAPGDDLMPVTEAVAAYRAERDERERRPLRLAALRGDADGVRLALDDGADVNEKAPDGHTPLLDAAREGHGPVVRALLEAGANPRIVDHLMKATPGHKAGAMGHPDAARALVENGRVELDAQGPYNGYTALHDAIWHGSLETARVYVDAGARLDLRALDGRTPMDMAREYGYDDIVALLRGSDGVVEPKP